jgi:hypothetical protein
MKAPVKAQATPLAKQVAKAQKPKAALPELQAQRVALVALVLQAH